VKLSPNCFIQPNALSNSDDEKTR